MEFFTEIIALLFVTTTEVMTREKTGFDKKLLETKVNQNRESCDGMSAALTQIPIKPDPKSPFVSSKLIAGILTERFAGNESKCHTSSPVVWLDVAKFPCQKSFVANPKPTIEVKITLMLVTSTPVSLTNQSFNIGLGFGLSEGTVKRLVVSETFTELFVRKIKSFVRLNWFVPPNSGVSKASIKCGKLVNTGVPFSYSLAPYGMLVSEKRSSLKCFPKIAPAFIGTVIAKLGFQSETARVFSTPTINKFAQLLVFIEPVIFKILEDLAGIIPKPYDIKAGFVFVKLSKLFLISIGASLKPFLICGLLSASISTELAGTPTCSIAIRKVTSYKGKSLGLETITVLLIVCPFEANWMRFGDTDGAFGSAFDNKSDQQMNQTAIPVINNEYEIHAKHAAFGFLIAQ